MNRFIYKSLKTFVNHFVAIKFLRRRLLTPETKDTYIFDKEDELFFRPNWDAPMEAFPKSIPHDMPEIIFQLGSGLYGVRDESGNFDEEKYRKIMSFCQMTEIKIAQGAKQTGGKLAAEKVSHAVAYYRNIPAYQELISPNRFPFGQSPKELFDFVAKLQSLSGKPVGIKIVISSRESIEPYAQEIQVRKERGEAGIPDFISIDGGDGGSATAPLFLMDRVGFHVKDAVHIADDILKEHGVREEVKIVASSMILTPDDVAIVLALGADFIQIGRGFMMSAGCIRARMCSGHGSHQCPVGLATQEKSLRAAYLVNKQAQKVANYHNNLLGGVRIVLAVMGLKSADQLTKKHLTFIDRNGFIYTNINRYLETKLKV